MKKVNLIALAMLAIYLAAPSLTLGQGGTVEQQIKTLSDQLAQAYVKDDTSFLEKYLADDYVGIFASSKPITKAESLKPGAVKYESFDVHEMKIRVYGRHGGGYLADLLERRTQSRREAIQWRLPHHSRLGEAERRLETGHISVNPSATSEQVSLSVLALSDSLYCFAALRHFQSERRTSPPLTLR